MSTDQPTGERGVFKLGTPPEYKERETPVEVIEIQPGWFRFNKETKEIEPFTPEAPKEVNAPTIITDEMAPTLNHANNKMYTSKRRLRDAYKALGVVETGGVLPKVEPKKRSAEDIRHDVEKALYDVRNNNVPATEQEKETWKREERKFQDYKKRQRAGTKSQKPKT